MLCSREIVSLIFQRHKLPFVCALICPRILGCVSLLNVPSPVESFSSSRLVVVPQPPTFTRLPYSPTHSSLPHLPKQQTAFCAFPVYIRLNPTDSIYFLTTYSVFLGLNFTVVVCLVHRVTNSTRLVKTNSDPQAPFPTSPFLQAVMFSDLFFMYFHISESLISPSTTIVALLFFSDFKVIY